MMMMTKQEYAKHLTERISAAARANIRWEVIYETLELEGLFEAIKNAAKWEEYQRRNKERQREYRLRKAGVTLPKKSKASHYGFSPSDSPNPCSPSSKRKKGKKEPQDHQDIQDIQQPPRGSRKVPPTPQESQGEQNPTVPIDKGAPGGPKVKPKFKTIAAVFKGDEGAEFYEKVRKTFKLNAHQFDQILDECEMVFGERPGPGRTIMGLKKFVMSFTRNATKVLDKAKEKKK